MWWRARGSHGPGQQDLPTQHAPPPFLLRPPGRDYNPYNYSDTISAYDKAALRETVYEDDVEQLRDGRQECGGENKMLHTKNSSPAEQLGLVAELLKELSSPSERPEERRGALVELLKIAREDSLAVWGKLQNHAAPAAGDSVRPRSHHPGTGATSAEGDLTQPAARFKNYAELTIMKTLELHKDSHKRGKLSLALSVYEALL
ncbi:CLIP-associating protein 1-like [Salvelinus sp. IW2-2015]|uniref:CLIP-associating protein 1-like n=1 Tax=Salvelinus sp. IW2-2015 TaxID=2691554 RepID=UPI0038D4E60E